MRSLLLLSPFHEMFPFQWVYECCGPHYSQPTGQNVSYYLLECYLYKELTVWKVQVILKSQILKNDWRTIFYHRIFLDVHQYQMLLVLSLFWVSRLGQCTARNSTSKEKDGQEILSRSQLHIFLIIRIAYVL